jgi:hypothetical protein
MWAMMEKLRISFVSVMGDLAFPSSTIGMSSIMHLGEAYQLGHKTTSPPCQQVPIRAAHTAHRSE